MKRKTKIKRDDQDEIKTKVRLFHFPQVQFANFVAVAVVAVDGDDDGGGGGCVLVAEQ